MYWHKALTKLNWCIILNLLGYVLLATACLMVFPLIVSLLYRESVYSSFLLSIAITLIVALPLLRIHAKKTTYFAKDGLIAVGLSWLLVSIFGALPFYLSREIPSFIDAFFETVSGFTTTGASILIDVEALSYGLLFWRSFTHWIGGMGVLVFILALLPKSNERTMHIMRAEAPGPTIGKLVPRLKKSAMILYLMYMCLSIIEFFLLCIGGMPLFDALVNTFATAGTGGFAIKSISIAAYDSVYCEMIISLFMLLFGVNFNLYYFLMIRNYRNVFRDEEMRTYFGIIIAAIICIAINIYPLYRSAAACLRYSGFQVASIITTTGFSSVDFNTWPSFSKIILLLLMVIGACAGSTGGGVKVSRMMIIVKKIKLDIQRMIHPQKVNAVTLNGHIVAEETVNQIMSFFTCYIIIMAFCLLLVSLDNFDIETTISSVFACLGNIGPGFGLCGPLGSFAMFSNVSKIILSAAMLIGRLEIYPIIIFLSPLLHRSPIKKGNRRNS